MGVGWGSNYWGSSLWGGNFVTPIATSASTVANSTTYADLLGLQLGMTRIRGELSRNYVKRLEAASHLRRDHPYEGALNEINLQLGTVPANYINVELADNQVINVSIAGVIIDNNPAIPLLTFDNDTMWDFRMLSDVVADINTIVPATLLVTDSPAFQLARQSNSLWSFSEPINGIQTQLSYSGIQISSVTFNQIVPAYTLTTRGLLSFTTEPISGTEITYNYIVTPYNLIGSPVVLIGLTDPEFVSVAETSTSTLAYQVSEFVQAIMTIDRSYWAN